jgi:serine phosphatase RsbU (regulator of sigma subunit)
LSRRGSKKLTSLLTQIASRLWDKLPERDELTQIVSLGDLLGILYGLPLSIIGLVWLSLRTDVSLMREEWLLFLTLLIAGIIVEELSFYMIVRLGNVSGGGSFYGSLSGIITWTAAFLLGYTGLWTAVLRNVFSIIKQHRHLTEMPLRWQTIRTHSFAMADVTVMSIIGLEVYLALDGEIPLPGFEAWPVAFAAISVRFILAEALTLPYITYTGYRISSVMGTSIGEIFWYTFVTLIFVAVIQPFSILMAAIYSETGWTGLIFILAALLLISFMANRLSSAVERSNQRTRELSQLEALGRAIIDGPPDASTLAQLLAQYVPKMFAQSGIAIRIYPDEDLLLYPANQMTVSSHIWQWIKTSGKAGYILPAEHLPWQKGDTSADARIYAPITDNETNRTIGAIYLLSVHPDRKGIVHWLPAVQALAAQIASTLHSARVYRQTLEHEKTRQELALAGRIQASFLPDSVPKIDGWQLTAKLAPARDTSGDYYDFIVLENNRLGLLVADVADKGVGAALYMALSRTLIRTYAVQHWDEPEEALRAANERILSDTKSNLFVTVFYGVLDLETGTLIYANAGHNPAYLCHDGNIDELWRTGLPLGMFRGMHWERKTVSIAPGELLVMYTDGLTEAHNQHLDMFGELRLLEIIQANATATAFHVQRKILREVHHFMGDYPQFDDITLMTVRRE